MQFDPVVAVHTTFSLSAVVLGPFALWARLGQTQRARWHRAAGYAWCTCMIGAAVSALFIRSHMSFSWHGYGPIHVFIPIVLLSIWRAFALLAKGNVKGHRATMVSLYISACVVTGLFTLAPQRALGQLIWGTWLGWL